MKEIVVSWTLLWWLIDGIGLLIWARVAGIPAFFGLGLLQIIVGFGTLYFTNVGDSPLGLLIIPLFLVLILLLVIRKRINTKRNGKDWDKAWVSLGKPLIWNNFWFVIGILPVIVLAFLAEFIVGDNLTLLEHIMWSYAVASYVAALSPPGAYGLSANCFTRWFMRLTIIASVIVAIVLLIAPAYSILSN